ncbi:unnamed protein product [Linum tenue]|uniref:Uncharacterized protein n=1 Tax=Linum tenue TaxID=586396 RepID=A0AAV0J2U3_9ROSI|nr:unnamed protein product [Linum tenue]
MILTGLLLYSRSMISMLFLGRLGELSLAGGSLALGFANITGYSILSGLAMGMEPICGQAFGAQKHHLLGLTLQRAVLLLLLTSLPITFLWLNMKSILVGNELGANRPGKRRRPPSWGSVELLPRVFGAELRDYREENLGDDVHRRRRDCGADGDGSADHWAVRAGELPADDRVRGSERDGEAEDWGEYQFGVFLPGRDAGRGLVGVLGRVRLPRAVARVAGGPRVVRTDHAGGLGSDRLGRGGTEGAKADRGFGSSS